ncbi:dihydropteroate synthase, partial [uncultured Helicobacter sp.]
MIVKRLNIASIPQAIQSMGTDTMGQKIMSKKAQILAFEIRNLSFEAANILKQEALSVGGECATPRGTITHKGEHIALLFGTQAQFAKLLPKLALQPFGLKSLKKTLESHLRPFHHTPEIMAIVNVTPDSFYAASRQSPQSAIHRICSLLEKDITYIDVGAASSRPGSELLDSQEEIARLKPVVEYIVSHHLYDKKCFSIDTYNPKTADYALCNGFSIINDVSGFSHNDMAKICAKHKARAILMHTKGTPKIMQNLTHTYTHLFDEIDRFFIDKIATFKDAGVEDIVLDIGFGFAKNK